LADVQRELLALGKRFTESDVAGFLLGEPLDAGRRGLTGKSLQADAATRRAAEASRLAEDSDDPDLHEIAKQAHHDAASYHAACVAYHRQQREYHHGRSNPAEPETPGQKTDDKPGESTPTPWDWLGVPDSTAAEAARLEQPADGALCCARALPSLLGGGELANVICYMPGGIHEITPSQGGKPVTVVVKIDELSAERMEEQRAALEENGNKPFFSVQHNTQIAAFWPTKFFWDTRPGADGKMVTGVWVQGEWSQAGKDAVEGKNFRSFSPTFFVDKISDDPESPAHVQSNPNAKLNMGALENDPAFTAIPPLWISQPQPRA
jgi:hypothetical protein